MSIVDVWKLIREEAVKKLHRKASHELKKPLSVLVLNGLAGAG